MEYAQISVVQLVLFKIDEAAVEVIVRTRVRIDL